MIIKQPCTVCTRRHGEYSGKDYEAVISRALLVKPLARHLQSYPDIYDVNVTCVEARPFDQPSRNVNPGHQPGC
jgi:hypothetical protein